MLRLMGKERDLRILTTVIFVFFFAIAIFYLYPLFIGFTALILYYWYISGPIFVGLFLCYRFFNAKRKTFRKSLLLDSLRFRENYELETQLKPIEKGALTKPYRKWLIKRNEAPIAYKFRQFFEKCEILTGIFLLFVLLSIFVILVYGYIFKIGIFNFGG